MIYSSRSKQHYNIPKYFNQPKCCFCQADYNNHDLTRYEYQIQWCPNKCVYFYYVKPRDVYLIEIITKSMCKLDIDARSTYSFNNGIGYISKVGFSPNSIKTDSSNAPVALYGAITAFLPHFNVFQYSLDQLDQKIQTYINLQ